MMMMKCLMPRRLLFFNEERCLEKSLTYILYKPPAEGHSVSSTILDEKEKEELLIAEINHKTAHCCAYNVVEAVIVQRGRFLFKLLKVLSTTYTIPLTEISLSYVYLFVLYMGIVTYCNTKLRYFYFDFSLCIDFLCRYAKFDSYGDSTGQLLRLTICKFPTSFLEYVVFT